MLVAPDASEATELPAELQRAVWSPDGELLVGADASSTKLIVVDRQGTVLAEIDTPGLGFYPSWQRTAP